MRKLAWIPLVDWKKMKKKSFNSLNENLYTLLSRKNFHF